jgi:hypothetical protein
MFPGLAETFIVRPFGQKDFFLAKQWNLLAGQVDRAKSLRLSAWACRAVAFSEGWSVAKYE